MKAPQGGYSLLEVMIFIAISGVIFTLTILSFKGQYATNEFITSMHDVNSKVQQFVDEVNNGYSGSPADSGSVNVRCKVLPSALGANGRPALMNGGGAELGTNDECIFLGKVMHINKDPDYDNQINLYPVIGRRIYQNSGDIIPVDNLAAANPEPGVGSPPPSNIDISEVYKIPHGARILWAKDGSGTERYLAGFFTSLNNVSAGGVSSNGNTNIMAVQYPFNGTAPPKANSIIRCIELRNSCDPGPVSNPFPMDKWEICFASTPDGNRALLTFSSSGGIGVQTDLQIGKMSIC
jgi:hypothetical protein